MQSECKDPLLFKNLKTIVVLLMAIVIIFLVFFKNIFFQSTFLLKSLGESSVDPKIAFTNNKPTFLEFYAEWCEVCKEMAPKVSALKGEYENEINFVFLNVDNQKWGKYIQKYDVNGIPQVNLFDRKGNLKSTFIGKQEESNIRDSIANLESKLDFQKETLSTEFSETKKNKNNGFSPRSHG